jgi:hypothetical protein
MSTTNKEDSSKGFFQKIRLRRKTSATKSKEMKKDQKKKSTVAAAVEDESILHTRRVIKATRPPSPTTEMSSMVSSSDQETIDSSASSAGDRVQLRGINIVPSVQDENLREKTEQWRNERLDASAATRKEKKEKEIMQHRLTTNAKSAKKGEAGVDEQRQEEEKREKIADMDVSDIFKTRTLHPENKRKGSTEDHSGKKTKIEEEKEEDKLTEKSSGSEMPGWITIVAPAVIVAACAFGFMMMKSLRQENE